jgi:hypothetical protein
MSDGSLVAARATARRGLERVERAIRLVGASPPRWFLPFVLEAHERLAEFAWLAGDPSKTRQNAYRVLEIARAWKTQWQRADAINSAETLLGYVELAEGRLVAAEAHLLASAQVPGSPVLDTWGPDLGLAAELLARGRRESVLQYLKLCKRFWDLGPGAIDRFEEAIRAGRAPDFSGHVHVAIRRALAGVAK